MALLPPSVVPAPQPRGLRYGLFTAATGPLELPPHARAGGLIYDPVSCGSAHTYPVECPEGQTPTEKVFDDADPLIAADPIVVYASYVCGAVGYSPAELEAKVGNRLSNGEQSAAEEALAAVLTAGAIGLPATSDIVETVGELEQWLYGVGGANYGHIGFLHAPIRLQSWASVHGLVQKDGPLQRTHLGTIWVFGGGYPDDGTVYISGHVTVWRSPDVSIPPASQVFNRATNQYRLIAEREYAVAYDCVAASSVFTPGLIPS